MRDPSASKKRSLHAQALDSCLPLTNPKRYGQELKDHQREGPSKPSRAPITQPGTEGRSQAAIQHLYSPYVQVDNNEEKSKCIYQAVGAS